MSEQENAEATAKPRRNRRTHKQNSAQSPALSRPTNDDYKGWKAYWEAQGQPWRTEPEIDEERQKDLESRRSITPDMSFILGGFLLFKGVKLSRADVEWLLAKHEDGRGPIDWNDDSQKKRKGLVLFGADLGHVDLSELPLARIAGSPKEAWMYMYDRPQMEAAAIHLEGADLKHSHLEEADLSLVHLEGANLSYAHLEGANLRDAHLEGANLGHAYLEGADLGYAHLEGADLGHAHLEGAFLGDTHLEGADLMGAFFDGTTELASVVLCNKFNAVSLIDVHWGDVNIAVVDWSSLSILGTERIAKETYLPNYRYYEPARAYRQLTVVLRNQGLNEQADHFAYRAQLMQRKVFWCERKIGRYLGSLFLDLLAGYGYRPWRSFVAYLVVITAFATAYFIIGHTVGPVLSPLGSFVFSMTSFHGRGFFPGGIELDDPLTVLAALEAFVGLLIEVTFIATLTQRLFSK